MAAQQPVKVILDASVDEQKETGSWSLDLEVSLLQDSLYKLSDRDEHLSWDEVARALSASKCKYHISGCCMRVMRFLGSCKPLVVSCSPGHVRLEICQDESTELEEALQENPSLSRKLIQACERFVAFKQQRPCAIVGEVEVLVRLPDIDVTEC